MPDLYRTSPGTPRHIILDAPPAACRLAWLLERDGPASRSQTLSWWPRRNRGAAARAWAQALEHGLIEIMPIAALPLEPAALDGPDPALDAGPASGWPAWTRPESEPVAWTRPESEPVARTRPESEPVARTQGESELTSFKSVSTKSVSSTYPTTELLLSTQGESEPVAWTRPESAWRRAQAALALQLTAIEYDTLVGPCRFLSCEDGELKLLVPNSVARDLLGNRLRPWLKEHLAQLLGEYVDVHLILDTGASHPESPDSPEACVRDLVGAGVWDDWAARLVRDYGIDACRQHLAALARLQAAGAGPQKPGGWLVRAIEGAWTHP